MTDDNAKLCADFVRVMAERDEARRELAEANTVIDGCEAALHQLINSEAARDAARRELVRIWCLVTESSPDDAPDPFPGGTAYDAVDKMQDQLFAARDAGRAPATLQAGDVSVRCDCRPTGQCFCGGLCVCHRAGEP